MTRSQARLVAVGGYVPERIVTNDEIAGRVETSDEWIVNRTGIRERRFAADEQTTTDLATEAALRTLEAAGADASDVDTVIVCTGSPDMIFPSTAALVAHRIGTPRAAAFDLSAACSGFVYGLAQGVALVDSGIARSVLVIGAEVFSRVTDQNDRRTCILFADGAGGALIVADEPRDEPGFLGWDLGSDGTGADDLYLPASGERQSAPGEPVPAPGAIHMDGRAVFRFATRVMAESSRTLLDELGLTVDDIDLVVPHQANARILEQAAERLGLPLDRLYMTLDRHGNTSAASIPIALADARDAGRLNPGDRLLLIGFGGGLSWGSTVVRYEPLGGEVPG